MPPVSVSIGTYNQAQYLTECIESVLSQTYPIAEIWVSDDASTDGTQEVMAEICKHHSVVRYHRHAVNLGIARNMSWVLAQPSTELIARIDSDDRLEAGFAATLADLMTVYPQAGYARSDAHGIDSRGARTRIRRLHRSQVYESPEESLKKSAQGYRVAANCIVFRAAALKQANYYYANDSWRSAEDWDLSLRMAILGWGNVYAAIPLANYRVWDDSGLARFKRKVPEIECVTRVYKDTLAPEYIKRGWNTEILRKNMRSRAVGYADALDSPHFSEAEREIYKQRLRELGDSAGLSLAIFLARTGLNPVARSMRRAKIRMKDLAKGWLRAIRRPEGGDRNALTGAAATTRKGVPAERQ